MDHLSREALQCPTHLHHSPAGVNAGQETKLAQSLAQGLFAYRNTLGSGHLLGQLIADDRVQKQINLSTRTMSVPLCSYRRVRDGPSVKAAASSRAGGCPSGSSSGCSMTNLNFITNGGQHSRSYPRHAWLVGAEQST